MCLHFAAPSNDAALPTADRGCSSSNKASSDRDYSSIIVWLAPTSLSTSSYLLSERSEARIPAEEPVFFEDVVQPIEEAERQPQTPRPYLLHDDASGVTLYRCSSVTASGFEKQSKLEDFLAQLPPLFGELVADFPRLFQLPDADPPNRSVKHYIFTAPDSIPAARPAYPLPHTKMQAMKTQMRELIDKGWVVPSSSLWASPILLVPKDQGANLRLCIDFRDLNALTKKDRFPHPRSGPSLW